MHTAMTLLAAADLQGLATSAMKLLSKIGGLGLLVFLGAKAAGHIARDQFGSAIGLVLVALLPAMFLFDSSGAQSLLTSTVKAIGG